MSNSQGDTLSGLFSSEAPNGDTPDGSENEGIMTDSSSESSSSSEPESEPEEPESEEEEPDQSSLLHVQVAEGPVRSGSFLSHIEREERYTNTSEITFREL